MAARKQRKVSDIKNLGGTEGTRGTPANDAGCGGSPDILGEGTEGTFSADLAALIDAAIDPMHSATGADDSDKFPGADGRSCWRVYDDWTGPKDARKRPGVWYHGLKSGKEDSPPSLFDIWLCSPLHIEAVTCGDDGRDFGRWLRFRDTYGRWRTWGMPMELLRGSCEELRGELLAAGLLIDHKERHRLADYLQWRTPEPRMTAATRTGWTADGSAFVLPSGVIGSDNVVFQAERIHQEGAAGQGGDYGKWKSDIAALCAGNPVLALSVCVALAGPLLSKVHRDSGGLHWVGDSSTGKTTALHVGASVWGGEGFRRTWRATANGLEGAAAALNDTCLCLDEINEADPKEVGSIVYSLGNGTGKSRASRIGSARQVHRWRITLLSTGERTLSAQMEEGGRKPKAGQLVRLLSIPAVRKHGVFDDLHTFNDGRALADHLRTTTGRHYGHAGPEFVRAMIENVRDFGAELAAIESHTAFSADDSQGGRAASRFALFGMAGELAIEWGILPWAEGEALSAAAECFKVFRESRGKGVTEDRQISQAVADFITRHGDSRFSCKDGEEIVVRDRAGWWTDYHGERVYLFTSEGLREATKGQDFTRVLRALDESGWIVDRNPGKHSKRTHIRDGRKLALYWIKPGEVEE